MIQPWPGGSAWVERHPGHQKVTGLTPGRGVYGRQPVDVSLSHLCFSLPPSSSLSEINDKISSGEDLKNICDLNSQQN